MQLSMSLVLFRILINPQMHPISHTNIWKVTLNTQMNVQMPMHSLEKQMNGFVSCVSC